MANPVATLSCYQHGTWLRPKPPWCVEPEHPTNACSSVSGGFLCRSGLPVSPETGIAISQTEAASLAADEVALLDGACASPPRRSAPPRPPDGGRLFCTSSSQNGDHAYRHSYKEPRTQPYANLTPQQALEPTEREPTAVVQPNPQIQSGAQPEQDATQRPLDRLQDYEFAGPWVEHRENRCGDQQRRKQELN